MPLAARPIPDRRYAVGLMSGTSADGIDAAVIEISGEPGARPKVRLLAFDNTPYPPRVREEIFALFDPKQASADRLGYMNVWLGERFAEAALSVIAKADLEPKDIFVVGSHGQTIFHAPDAVHRDGYALRFSLQIGEGAVIAARTGIPCVSDFRMADMAAGGQGAPLVPFTEYLLYREEHRTILLQNIGGMGNITVLPAGCAPEEVIAFDTGPGNVLIDGLVSRLYPGLTMDKGGVIARRGRVDVRLLEQLKQEPYYRLPPPKSTGRERFGAACIDRLLQYQQDHGVSNEDLIATVTMLTAWSIGDAYRRFIHGTHPADRMIVGGGGSYNPVLLGFLKQEMEPCGVEVVTQEDLGMNSDAKEAVAFALLADCALAGIPNHLPRVTGAREARVLGKISL